jgi:YjbE family integral membrane protein
MGKGLFLFVEAFAIRRGSLSVFRLRFVSLAEGTGTVQANSHEKGACIMDFFLSLLAIITIDLLLAGDNALVIGMAARNLPAHQQKRAIIWGTAGAIVIRAISTVVVVWLLSLTGLKLVGGFLLVWIAFKLLVDHKEEEGHVDAGMSLWKAISTIIIADTVMGLDNVLAVAGAAHGDFILVVVGLLISIPIMVFGSTLVIKLMDRFPWFIYLGSGVLAWTAAKMITGEHFIHDALAGLAVVKWLIILLVVGGTLFAGWLLNKRREKAREASGTVLHEQQEHHTASA